MMRTRRSTILSNTDTVLEDLGPAKPYTISVRDTSNIKGRGTVVPRLAAFLGLTHYVQALAGMMQASIPHIPQLAQQTMPPHPGTQLAPEQ
ncbi:hypothetical protein B296_00028470 [Ensete ventricosum]|uniref:Uncharacterized protein n=1 Tax=Ensete ventricosum TaxID=4639 RepID=A0A427ADL7_ENSVE|nr:hypothetical protein B296_00028470 [Ensete ventricosum]